MKQMFSASLVAAALLLLGGTAALSQSAQNVQLSGKTFHVAVCPGPTGPGAARCHARVVTDRAGNRVTRDLTAHLVPSGYGPASLQSAYSVGNLVKNVITGPVVVIVDAYGYPSAETDLGVYRAQYGLPACTTANGCFKKVNQLGVQGNYPQADVGWDEEQALDIEMVSAICPSAG